ncbi:MAG: hypothetical protein EOO03_11255 [Chitinophagaceae bacterium]|nr:MAG: hypothetical protein EOO03_11255 [Chitinophagaceae bacterium]
MMGKFANILKGLKDVSEGDKNLLYNSAVLAFSEIGSSSGHDQKNLGLILAGNAGGALNPGRAIDFTGQGMINSNLLVTIMQSLGMPDTKQGSSDNGKGPIKALLA